MSHSIEYFQRMTTEQLIHEMNHAAYSMDRDRARQVYEDRIRAAERNRAYSDHQIATLNSQVTTLQSNINTLTHRNANLANIIRQQSSDLQDMQRTHNRQIENMRTDYNRRIREVSAENRAAINALEVKMNNNVADLHQTINANYQRTTAMINAVNSSLTDRINTIHTDLSARLADQQQQISTLDAKFQKLEKNDNQLRENAQEYLEAAIALINATIEYNNSNRHNWRKNDLDALRNIISHVQSDLGGGMLAVGNARGEARNLFEAALRYRADVYADECEWQLRHATAQQCVDAANIDLEMSRTIEADGMKIDVDYWTCGDLKRIETQLIELQTLLENPNLTNEELAGIGELAETYRQEIGVAVNFAMQAVQCSMDRKELLEIAVDHIENTVGILHPEWEEYFAGDARLGYRIYLTSPLTGERVVLTAEPSIDQTDVQNQFRFEILSTGSTVHNAADANHFTTALAQALSQVDGCVFTAPNCTNHAAPAPDEGQGNHFIWKTPSKDDQAVAVERAAPVHAPHSPKPVPAPVHTFVPQQQI